MKLRILLLVAGVAVATASQAALIANFDSFSEGDVFDTFTDGGITFSNVFRHQTSYTNFAIENASNGELGGNFSSPNVLGFGGYVPGGGVAFGAFGGLTFSAGNATSAGLDLWTFPLNMGGNTITLTGYKQGQVVNSDSYLVPTFSTSILYHRFDLSNDDYDLFKLTSDGPSVQGDSFIDIDNVQVQTSAVPEPAVVAGLGLGLLAVRRRRKR